MHTNAWKNQQNVQKWKETFYDDVKSVTTLEISSLWLMHIAQLNYVILRPMLETPFMDMLQW